MPNMKPLADLASRALRSDTARQLGRTALNEGTRIAKEVVVPAAKRELQKGALSALQSRTSSATAGPRSKTDFSAMTRPSPFGAPGGAKAEPEVVMTERPQIEPQPGSPGYSAPSGGPGGTPSLRDQLKATAKSTLQQAAQSAFKAASGVATDGAQQAHAAVMGKLGLPADAKPHQMLGLERPPITPKDLQPLLQNLFRRLSAATTKAADGNQRAQQVVERITGSIGQMRQFVGGQLDSARKTKASLEAKFAHLPTTGPQVRVALGNAMLQLADVIGRVQEMLEAESQRMSGATGAKPAEPAAAPAGPVRSEADLATMKKMGLPADASDRDIVGASADADDAQVRTSYRQTMLKHHPDKPGGSAEAAALISGAFERLGVKPAGSEPPAEPASIEGKAD